MLPELLWLHHSFSNILPLPIWLCSHNSSSNTEPMKMMDVMSVDEAAEKLRVSPSRVRARIAAGDLPAHHFAGRWALDPSDVAAAAPSEDGQHQGGRPMSPRMVWGLIALADGIEPIGLSNAERSRLRSRLRSRPKLAELARLARKRAVVHRFRAHPGVLPRVLAVPGVVPAGLSAQGHDLVQPDMVEIYLPEHLLDVLVNEFAARPASRSEANLVARIPSISPWPMQGEAGRLAVAFDLWEAGDVRSRRAAENLYRSVLRSKRFNPR
jgi:excisionase family DNA binding protein